jgi:hypothetical protein
MPGWLDAHDALMQTRNVRSGTVVTLAVVVGLLVAATGVFVALYVMKRGDVERATGEIARTERTIDNRQERLGSIESTVDQLEAARTGLEDDNQRLHACADPARDMFAAAQAGDKAALDEAVDGVVRNCAR